MTLGQQIKRMGIGAVAMLALYASGFLVIFSPLPVVYLSVTRSRREGLGAAILAAVLAAAAYLVVLPVLPASTLQSIPIPGVGIGSPIGAEPVAILGLGYFAFFLAIAIALAEGAHRRWPLVAWCSVALAAGIAVAAATVAAEWLVGGGAFFGALHDYVRTIVNEVVNVNAAADGAAADAGMLAEHAGDIAAFLMGILPACGFVFALFAVVINFLVSRRFIRAHHLFAHVHNVARFRLPDAIVWAVIASGLAFFADRYLLHTSWLELVAINGLIAAGAIYFFQGLAVVVYFVQGIRLPLFKTIAYVAMILFFQTISMAIVAIGVADVWANFRMRHWRARHHQI